MVDAIDHEGRLFMCKDGPEPCHALAVLSSPYTDSTDDREIAILRISALLFDDPDDPYDEDYVEYGLPRPAWNLRPVIDEAEASMSGKVCGFLSADGQRFYAQELDCLCIWCLKQ